MAAQAENATTRLCDRGAAKHRSTENTGLTSHLRNKEHHICLSVLSSPVIYYTDYARLPYP